MARPAFSHFYSRGAVEEPPAALEASPSQLLLGEWEGSLADFEASPSRLLLGEQEGSLAALEVSASHSTLDAQEGSLPALSVSASGVKAAPPDALEVPASRSLLEALVDSAALALCAPSLRVFARAKWGALSSPHLDLYQVKRARVES